MGVRRISPAKLVENIYQQGRSYHDGKRYVGFEGGKQKEIPTPNGSWTRKPMRQVRRGARINRLPVTTTTLVKAG